MSDRADIAIIGAGAFGTALACVVARRGQRVDLVGRNKQKIADIEASRLHPFLPRDAPLPAGVSATADPACLQTASIVLFAVPSQALRETARDYRTRIADDAALVICAKGIEQESGRFLSDVLHREIPGHDVAALSGPGFAADIVRRLPTAMTIACSSPDQAAMLSQRLSGETFRLYSSTDVAGVQIGGALKNVMAIACGVVEGRGLGESARAALIARGLAELGRFAAAHGGRPQTVAGLSGLGDLVLTATSHQSRNMRFGVALGQGEAPQNLLAPGKPLAEGAYTARIAAQMADSENIVMPITQAVAAILDGALSIDGAIEALMNRPLTTEID